MVRVPPPQLGAHSGAAASTLSLWLQVCVDSLHPADAAAQPPAPASPASPELFPPERRLLLPALRTLRQLLEATGAQPKEAELSQLLPTVLRLVGAVTAQTQARRPTPPHVAPRALCSPLHPPPPPPRP